MNCRKSAVGIALLLGASCEALFPSAAVQAQTWMHPGIVVNKAQLDATRAAYQSGNAVIVDQVNKAMNSNYVCHSARGREDAGRPELRLPHERDYIEQPGAFRCDWHQ